MAHRDYDDNEVIVNLGRLKDGYYYEICLTSDGRLQFDLWAQMGQDCGALVATWPLEDFVKVLDESWKAACTIQDARLRPRNTFRSLSAAKNVSKRQIALLGQLRAKDRKRRIADGAISVSWGLFLGIAATYLLLS